MAGDKSTGSIHSAYKDNGTSTSNFYSSVNISAIKTALDGVLPAKYKITSLQIKITASFTCNSNARVYIQAGLSNSTNSIGTTILEEKQIGEMKKEGTETYTRDITSYLASDTSSNITTSYGSYLVFRMQSDNWFKKTFTINSVTLTVKYNDYYTVTVNVSPEGAGTVSGTGSYVQGSTATVKATPNAGYKFVGFSNQNGVVTVTTNPYVFTVNDNTTFYAVFEQIPPPKFTSVEIKYLDKQVSPSNKVIVNESFIISVSVT